MADCNTYAGKNTFLLFGVESEFNTPVATTKDIGTLNSISPDWSNNLIEVREIGSRESAENVVGNFDVTIGVDGTLNSGAILELFFGQSTDTETTGDYKHTFVNRGTLDILNCADSFTVSENYSGGSDVVYTYSGCKINTLDVSFEQGGTLDFSAEIIGSSVATTTSAGTQITTTTSKLSSINGTLSTGDSGSEAEVGRTRSVSISLNNNIDASDTKAIGSRFNQDLVEKNLDCSIEFTKTFVNKTESERFLGDTSPQNSPTDTAVILSINNGVTLGSGRIEFYIKVIGGQYESTSKTISQDGVVEETFNYVGGNIDDVWFVDAVTSYF